MEGKWNDGNEGERRLRGELTGGEGGEGNEDKGGVGDEGKGGNSR